MQTGLPPKVLACEPGTQSMMSAFAMQTPSGMPEAMPLAMQTMSGSTPACSIAHHLPVRPTPDWISSAISRMPWRSQMVRSSRRKLVGSDDVSAFALDRLDDDGGDFFRRKDGLEELLFDVARAGQSQRLALVFGCRLRSRDRRMGYGTCVTPGTNGAKRRFCWTFDAVSDSAPMVRPWKHADRS